MRNSETWFKQKWRVIYVHGNTYKVKYVWAVNVNSAINKAKVKNIVDIDLAE